MRYHNPFEFVVSILGGRMALQTRSAVAERRRIPSRIERMQDFMFKRVTMLVGRVIAMQAALRLCIGAEPVVWRSSQLDRLIIRPAARGRHSGRSGD